MKKKAAKSKGALSLEIVPFDDQNRLMGEQLTAQYQRATGGAKEILIFGAMMMQLRERLLMPTAGIKLPKGVNAKDGGMQGWLERNAPTVKRQTAQRFEAVSNAIATEFQLPKTLANKISFSALVTDNEKHLAKIDRRLPGKQKEVFKMAEGTSQRSWLDKFNFKHRGGNTYERTDGKGLRLRMGQRELLAAVRKRVCSAASEIMGIAKHSLFRVLNEAELDLLIDETDTLAINARAWRAKSKTERDEIMRAELAKQMKKS